MKIYTIISPYNSLVKKRVKEILKNYQIAPDNVTIYDMMETTIQDALFDVASAGFLASQKAILVKDPYFLTGKRISGPEHDIDKLTSYLNNPSAENVLIFHASYEKLDARKKVVKLLKNKSEYIEVNPPNEFNLIEYTKRELSRFNIGASDPIPKTLVTLTKGDIDKLISELTKIRDYFGKSGGELTLELVHDLIPQTVEDNIFLLNEALANKNVKEAYKIFSDLMIKKEEPIMLIVMIANQFRLFKQIQVLQTQGMHAKDIAVALDAHPYRVKIVSGQAKKFKSEELEDILEQLANADLQIKTGQMDAQMALELFILDFSHIIPQKN